MMSGGSDEELGAARDGRRSRQRQAGHAHGKPKPDTEAPRSSG
jgi:hypothetical protein